MLSSPAAKRQRRSARVADAAVAAAACRPPAPTYGEVLAGARRQRISPQFRRGFLSWVRSAGSEGLFAEFNAANDGLVAHALRFAALSSTTALEFVTALLDAGADPNLESAGVGSPLAAAVWYKMPAAQSLLLERGARPASDLPIRLAVVNFTDAKTVERLLHRGCRHTPARGHPSVLGLTGGDVRAQMHTAAHMYSALGHAMRDKKKTAAVDALRRAGAWVQDCDFFAFLPARGTSPVFRRFFWSRHSLCQTWTPSEHWSFPPAFRGAVMMVLRHANSAASVLDTQMWTRVLRLLDRYAVVPPPLQ